MPAGDPPWIEDDGYPSWRPQTSVQSSSLFDAIHASASGPERDKAVDAWAREFREFNINYLLDNHKKGLESKLRPRFGVRRPKGDGADWYAQQLSYVEPIRAWWHDWVTRRTEDLKENS